MTDHELIGFRTTFSGLFSDRANPGATIDTVEIPLIQRDYAQGRDDPRSTAIRGQFLDALGTALRGDSFVGLDFIYGDVRAGTFEPLDGQQRLTTLFLLHWYVASRLGILGDPHGWTKFSYATRPSARLFCERIVDNAPPTGLEPGKLPSWLTDQSWYLYVWRHDPTIGAMLVTIDDIDARFHDDDMDRFWSRLTDDVNPAIWFQLLPIAEIGAPEDLYIKMNSRGKPLTEFEAFKASLGRLVADLGRNDFGHLIDGPWTDVLWPYRGDNNIVDDEFMHYFDFLIEICEWREVRLKSDGPSSSESRMKALLGAENPSRDEHVDFIYAAFNAWRGEGVVDEVFDRLFSDTAEQGKLRLFGNPRVDVNLLRACSEKYGNMRGTTRVFSLTDTLLLYAVLVHMAEGTPDVDRCLRTLRNVNEASQFEMRVQNMPKFVDEVAVFMRSGDVSRLATFNQNQVEDERSKQALRESRPDLSSALDQLEDSSILRGTLASFNHDERLVERADAFVESFQTSRFEVLTGALLATGEYQRDFANSDCHQMGSPTSELIWRGLLVDRGDREALAPVRFALEKLLDRIVESADNAEATMRSIIADFINARDQKSALDWRYYLVKYSSMREGNSGRYYGANRELGFELTMLRKSVQSSYYRDAYLYAMWVSAGNPGKSLVKDPWFYGYSTEPRWMTFIRSQAGLRNTATHLLIRSPLSDDVSARLAAVCAAAGASLVDGTWELPIAQTELEGRVFDTVDRVQVGAKLIGDLIEAGL